MSKLTSSVIIDFDIIFILKELTNSSQKSYTIIYCV